MWFLKEDPTPEEGKVYRVVIDSHTCELGQLVAVFSPTPVETIKAYYQRAGTRLVEQPTLVENLKPTDKGIDHWIKDSKGPTGFALMNRLKLRWLDWMLLGQK